MLDLIQQLPPGARVLDLGARTGSFRTGRTDLAIVRLDLEIPSTRGPGSYVAADAALMPFQTASFHLVISNHSLEHFPELDATVREIGRVIRPDGALYVAVPDAGTFADRVYRWMAKGGGHVNAFRSAEQVTGLVERLTGLPHRSTQELYSSLAFLNAHNFVSRPPRKIFLFGNGNERFLAALAWTLRWLDQKLHTRLSRYGWAFCFGKVDRARTIPPWVNVCVRCGSGHAVVFLRKIGAIPPIPRACEPYQCPTCGARNLLSEEPES